jgi:hypothetical protein
MRKIFGYAVLLSIVGGFSISLESCHDPCDDSKRVSAEFLAYNELYYWDKENGKPIEKTKVVEEDTFMLGYVNFEAIDQSAESYEWTIGSDPKKRTEKKFTLLFQDPAILQESPISVKLKIKKDPDSKCYPHDPGVDSVTHLIYFLSTENWPIFGAYKGTDDTDPNSTFTIEIYRDSKSQEIFIANLPNACNPNNPGIRIGYSTAFEFALNNFPAPQNYFPPLVMNCYVQDDYKKIGGLMQDRKNIVIDYEFTEGGVSETQRKHRIFKGAKII